MRSARGHMLYRREPRLSAALLVAVPAAEADRRVGRGGRGLVAERLRWSSEIVARFPHWPPTRDDRRPARRPAPGEVASRARPQLIPGWRSHGSRTLADCAAALGPPWRRIAGRGAPGRGRCLGPPSREGGRAPGPLPLVRRVRIGETDGVCSVLVHGRAVVLRSRRGSPRCSSSGRSQRACSRRSGCWLRQRGAAAPFFRAPSPESSWSRST